MRSTLETLIQAKAVIADPNNWCQDRLVDEFGRRCALGAIQHAQGSFKNTDPSVIALSDAIGGFRAGSIEASASNVASFNNHHTHTELMEVWDRAIAVERIKEEALNNSFDASFDEAVEEDARRSRVEESV